MAAGRTCTRIFLSVALIATLAPSRFAHAQDKTRNLTGTVKDHGREPLRGAVVQLENESTHSVISYITSRTGQYSFKRIGGDTDYTVWATYRGVTSQKKSLDKFSIKRNPKIDLTIQLR